jgi:hypothetical protein
MPDLAQLLALDARLRARAQTPAAFTGFTPFFAGDQAPTQVAAAPPASLEVRNRALLEKAARESALLQMIRSKIIYDDSPPRLVGGVIGKGGQIIPLERLGLEPDPGRRARGIDMNTLTPQEMEYLIGKHQGERP